MACYVNGIGAISPQKQFTTEGLLSEPLDYSGERLTCVEPDYAGYFDVRQLRRMSRIIRMGMAAGIDALREGGLKVPDGIITGTGYGCLDDTGAFLSKMIENQETALNPTPFIQSTHNTIGSQLALLLQCQGYNQTYTQRGLSFENGLTDAIMMIADDPTQRLLAGAADETTTVSHDILRRFNLFRRNSASSLNLLKTQAKGTLNGEGAAYFLLSSRREPGAVELQGVQSFYKPSPKELESGIADFLRAHSVQHDDVDVLFTGKCGDASSDTGIEAITALFPHSTEAAFKHLTGEFPGAQAIAMAIACRMIQSGTVPSVVVQRNANRKPRQILIYNRYLNTYHSLILLAASNG